MRPHFCVVVPAFNCAAWIVRSLESIAEQSYTEYSVVVVDDASTDSSMREKIRSFCRPRGWKWRFEPINRGSLHSIYAGIEELGASGDQVVVTVDGDDWLAHSDVFSYVASVYEKGDVDLTYGHFRYSPSGEEAVAVPYQIGAPRSDQGEVMPAPLRTFRAALWHAINPDDLKDERGEFLRYATDWAFMMPMMEMAGDRIHRIDEVLYVYNFDNPINEWKVAGAEQQAVKDYIRSLPNYAEAGALHEGAVEGSLLPS